MHVLEVFLQTVHTGFTCHIYAYTYIGYVYYTCFQQDLLVIANNFAISCIPLLLQVPPQQPTGFPTLLGHLASSDFIHPLYVLPVKSDGKSLGSVYRPLSSPPPCDVHVVTLRTMQPIASAAGKTAAAAGRQTALILHRTAVDCSFPLPQSVASCPAAGGKVITQS